ncbi:MAG: DNA (cytosine-5-)-methyltransferase [Eubacterium sp.]
MEKLKVGSLFSGIGGIDIGFMQAGFRIIWANESDSAACKTYRHDFKNHFLEEKNISNVHPANLSRSDVLVAGFPCQPFSIAGRQRGFKDPRGNMFFEIARIVETQKPKIIFLENVAHLQEHDNGHTFLVIYNTLATLGYSVRYHIMSAHEYGNLPQTRKRIFIIAFLDDARCDSFHFPKPVKLTVSINQIINRSVRQHEIYYYTGTKGGALAQNVTDYHSIYRLTDRGLMKVKNNLCPTLTANMGTYPDRVPIVCDDFGVRKLTLRECLDFQGFPRAFKFPTTITINDAYKQIGNSVVVPVIRRIAEIISTVF